MGPGRGLSAVSSGASRGRSKESRRIERGCAYVDISVPPFKRKRIQVETTRNAFAYVFAGAGTFRDASDPQAVLTESAVDPAATPVYDAKNHSLVLFDRGDEIVVQAGPEGFGSCWSRQAAGGAGGLVRPDRDEHPGRAATGYARTAERVLHSPQVIQGGGPLSGERRRRRRETVEHACSSQIC